MKKKCERCNGTGRIDNIVMDIVIIGAPVGLWKDQCPDCNGTGEVNESINNP